VTPTIIDMRIFKKILPVLIGTAAGFAYWYFIGCLNGSCPITGRWYTSTLYGAVVGATWLLPTKKKIVASETPADPASPVAPDQQDSK
jgi:hypothetical protein